MREPPAFWATLRQTGTVWAILIVGLSLSLAISVKGVPVLRHDWAWPLSRGDFAANAYYAFSGWFDFGYGEPNPYPNAFLTAPALAVLGFIFGPLITLQLLFFFIAAALGTAVTLVGKAIGAPRFAIVAAVILSCLNPWTYNEIVAGHIGMLFGYCSVLLLLGAVCSGLSETTLLLILVLSFSQIQFFLPVGIAVAVIACRLRYYRILAAYIALIAPLAVGIAGNLQALSTIPDLPEWRVAQSVPPLSALGMSGYFANYAKAFDGTFARLCEYVLAGLSFYGIAIAPFNWKIRIIIFLQACVVLAMCSGSYAPWFAAGLKFIAPPLPSVYREMYDLIPFLIVVYVLGGMAVAARHRLTAILWSIPAFAVGALWFFIPVSTYWVSGSQIHRIDPEIARGYRYAVLPAFQPLQLHHNGSGADPDVRPFVNGIAAVNEYVPQYPVGMALSRFSLLSDSSELAALGVQKIYIRNNFSTDPQSQFWDHAKSPVASAVVNVAGARPLFTTVQRPIHGPADGDESMVWEKNAPDLLRFTARANSLNPNSGWISLNFATTRFPAFDDPRGGVLTTSRRRLRVHNGARYVLTSIKGRLRAFPSNKIIAVSGRGYTWASLPSGTRAIECDGVCSVLADARSKFFLGPHPKDASLAADRFFRIAPWLYEVFVPNAHGALLRFNTRYEGSWAAFASRRRLSHIRLSPSTNGWVIGKAAGTVVIVNWVAGVQAISSLFAAMLIYVFLVCRLLRPAVLFTRKNNCELPITS